MKKAYKNCFFTLQIVVYAISCSKDDNEPQEQTSQYENGNEYDNEDQAGNEYDSNQQTGSYNYNNGGENNYNDSSQYGDSYDENEKSGAEEDNGQTKPWTQYGNLETKNYENSGNEYNAITNDTEFLENQAAQSTGDNFTNTPKADNYENGLLQNEFPNSPANDSKEYESNTAAQIPNSSSQIEEDGSVNLRPDTSTPISSNQFGGAPPVPGTRRIMADGEAPEDYVVEPGDTLYDICDQLLDEPNYWPKLWSLNPFIKNPHFIYPGSHLRFYPGDASNLPYLEVVSEDDVVPVDKGDLVEGELVQQDVSGLIDQNNPLPASEIIDKNSIGQEPLQDFEAVGSYFQPVGFPVLVPALIFKKKVDVLGIVIRGPMGSELIGSGDKIAVEGKDIENGTTYLVLRPSHEVYARDKGYIGFRYEVVGAVTILKTSDNNEFLGTMKLTRLGGQRGDILTSYKSILRNVPQQLPQGVRGSGNAVVGFGFPNKFFGGTGDFVLLEKDSGSMSTGQTLRVFQEFRQLAILGESNKLGRFGENVADIYLLDDTSDVFVGIIVRGFREVRLGDTLGRG